MITALKVLLAIFGGLYVILGIAMLLRREACAHHLQAILQEHFTFYVSEKTLKLVVTLSAIIVTLTSAAIAIAAIAW